MPSEPGVQSSCKDDSGIYLTKCAIKWIFERIYSLRNMKTTTDYLLIKEIKEVFNEYKVRV